MAAPVVSAKESRSVQPSASPPQSERIARSVAEGLARYSAHRVSPVDEPAGPPSSRLGARSRRATAPAGGVIAAIPRRKIAVVAPSADDSVPAMARAVRFEASSWAALLKLLVWLYGATRFFSGLLLDVLTRRSSEERSAARLRRTLESMGPTFIKLGQQLSIRADIFPTIYCEELADIRDEVTPFPTKLAISRIEKASGKPISEVFAIFDPVPIASTSVACVYQALLPDGEKVGVKVRRPGIGEGFAACLVALGWILDTAETFAFVRQGSTRDLRDELKMTLFESLNYWLEARYNEIFARRAKKKQQDHILAPKVYFELSGEDVLVTEFVSGVFLYEILEAIEQEDDLALAQIRERGIDPQLIAQRITRAFFWEAFENIFFHADPHPTKIVARPDNSLVFVDFGQCGRFSEKTKRYYQQLQEHILNEDVGGMVEATISMLEPLPPIDLDRFTKEVESLYWDWLYVSKSKHSGWWERATGEVWRQIMETARRYRIPINLDILRMFRATFVYDSVALRLWDDLNLNREYRTYSKERGHRTRRRIRRRWRRMMEKGPSNSDYLAIQDFGRLTNQVLHRVQHVLDSPAHRFAGMIGKAAFGVSMTLRFLTIGVGLHVAGLLVTGLVLGALGRQVDLRSLLTAMVTSLPYQVLAAVVLLVLIRKALMRFEDIDVDTS